MDRRALHDFGTRVEHAGMVVAAAQAAAKSLF